MNANLRNFALWVIIVLLLLALFTLFQSPGQRPASQDISFSELLTDVDTGRVRDVIAQVVDHTLHRAAVEEVAVGVRELRFKDSTNPPSRNRVCECEGQYADDTGEEIAQRSSVEDIGYEEGCECEIDKGNIERRGEIVPHDACNRFSGSD